MSENRKQCASVMRTAHREWRATRHKPTVTFARCLKLAWIVEKQRAAKAERERQRLAPKGKTRDIIWIRSI